MPMERFRVRFFFGEGAAAAMVAGTARMIPPPGRQTLA